MRNRISILSLFGGLACGLAIALIVAGRHSRAAADDSPAPPPTVTLPDKPIKVITADTDINRIETIHVTHSEKPKLSNCFLPPDYKAQKCMKVLKGPFVVTDLSHNMVPNPNALFEVGISMFVAGSATEPEEERFVPRWRVQAGNAPIHGGRFQVRANEWLFIADPPIDAFRNITVSGFRPY